MTETNNPSEISTRLPCLDGLRAIGIIFVMMAHLQNVLAWHIAGFGKAIWDGLGPLGVNLFFGLSGYIITHLFVREFRRSWTVSLRNFYMRRVLRIFPAFYLYLAVICALVFLGVLKIPLVQLARAAAYLTNYYRCYGTTDFWFVGHTWSLAMEEQFYLFWPVFLILVRVDRGKGLALMLIVLMPVLRVACYFLLPASRSGLGETTHTSVDLLMYGCLLAFLEGNSRFEWAMDCLKKWVFPLGAGVFLLFVHPLLENHFRGVYELPIGISLEAGLIAFIVAWCLRNPLSMGGAFLNSQFMMHIGVLSYSLYLWQQLFLTNLNQTILGAFPIGIFFSYAAACASYYLMEKRFLNLRRQYR